MEKKNTYTDEMEWIRHTEENILGFILNNPEQKELVTPFVTAEFFENKRNQLVYSAILKAEEPNFIEVGNVLDEKGLLKKAPRSYLSELVTEHYSLSPIIALVRSLREHAKERMMTKMLDKCKKPEEVQEGLIRIQEKFDDSFENEDVGLKQTLIDLYKRRQEGNMHEGYSTGFPDLDNYILGLIKGKFIVIGGYNNHGKSTLAINLLNSALKQGAKCLFFSLEMEQGEILVRVMACRNGIKIDNFFEETKDPLEEERIYKAFQEIENDKLDIVTSTDDIDEILGLIRKEKPDVVVIDYLQNLSSKIYPDRRELLEYASKKLRIASLQENVCIMALSQVNEANAAQNALQSGLKGSGDISSASDITLRILRKFDQKGVKDDDFGLMIVKSRYGKTGNVRLHVDETKGKLSSVVYGSIEQG